MPLQILAATTDELKDAARTLILEYAASLPAALGFQDADFDRELTSMYIPPSGIVLLALEDPGVVGGCVALRRFDEEIGEMKRLYVRPAWRGRSVGRRLVEAVIAEARRVGYRRIRLDTLSTMDEARRMYATFGFREIPAYDVSPIAGTSYMELRLD